jgi:glycine betaine/proline transport system permease protein
MQWLFDFVKDDLGLIHLTRGISAGLEWLLDTTANLLHGKRRWPHLGPIPWTAIAAGAGVLGYWLGGWSLAALASGTFLWTAVVGQWEPAMQTMAVIVVAAPVAFVAGLGLGILAWKYRGFERAIQPLLSVLQTLPFFTYLLPAVIFFKVGPTAGAVATVFFAMPPMILMTTLGLRKVSPDVVEAGKMSGCGRWQMLFHVYLPAARTEILVGVNQVIMLCLAMVVLTAFIGMPGLGAKLLALMNSFKLGRSFEIGVTIVLLAIALDRLSKAWVVKQPEHFKKGTPWWARHRFLLSGAGVFLAFTVLGQFIPLLGELKRTQNLSVGREIDVAIKWFLDVDAIQAMTEWLRWFLNTQVLIPFRDAILWLPTSAVILAIAALGWLIGGRRSALIAGGFFLLVAATGWWDRSMITLYTVISAVVLAALFGIPLGILAARSAIWSRRILLACDTAQTFPSFIYLIPAIMLFGVNDVAVVFSILIFAMVPLTRYTIEGLRTVPPTLSEVADMSGATRWKKLLKVELPLALPTMAVGFNQAVMFAFFMVIIAAFIGTQDLGQELQKTLAGNELGKNFVLGICVSSMALAFGHLILGWADRRKRALGLA